MVMTVTSAGFLRSACHQRYLMFLSHTGPEFRGMQRQGVNRINGREIPVTTVQETLEKALQQVLNPLHDIIVNSSSRTDSGVHAIRTSVYVNMSLGRDMQTNYITSLLNKYFLNEDIGIRIQSIQPIPNDFSPRSEALTRTYVYRFAIRKTPLPEGVHRNLAELPISEHKKTYFIQNSNTCIEKMREAAKELQGTHDFFTFMGRPKKATVTSTVRTIYSLDLEPAHPSMPDHDICAQSYNFWHLTCEGKAFLYRQIRRTMGVLLAVGQGKLNMEDVRRLLDKPCLESWDPNARCAPPWGLYLSNITFNPIDLDPSIVISSRDYDTALEDVRTTYALTG